MKTLLIVALAMVALFGAAGMLMWRHALAGEVQTPAEATKGSFWDLETHTLAGEPVALSEWTGKVVLVVNVASKCGLTPQYEGLQAMHEELAGEDFAILAFPSNDFLGQEPGTPEEIHAFCSTNYGVEFPMFEKVVVKGDQKDKIYSFLTAGGLDEPSWNFTKYLVGRDGKVIARFAPKTTPDDPELREAIAKAIAAE